MSARQARLAIAHLLFDLGVVVLIAGSWLASAWWLLASCLIGGIVLFALAELIAPFPVPGERRRRPGVFVQRR